MDELEALALALEVEKAKLRLYLRLARRTKDEGALKTFLFLAREETQHWEEAERRLLERVAREGRVPDEVDVGNLVPEVATVESRVEAIKLALRLEKLSWEFYERAAREADSASLGELFRELAREEKSHYELLKALYDSVMKTGIWMGHRDFSLEVD